MSRTVCPVCRQHHRTRDHTRDHTLARADTWTKRDTSTSRFTQTKKSGGRFKGVRTRDRFFVAVLVAWVILAGLLLAAVFWVES